MAVRGFCGVCRGIVSAAGHGTEVAEGLHRFLGAPARPYPGEKQFWSFAERCRSAVAGITAYFAEVGTSVSGRNLLEGRVRAVDAEITDARGQHLQRRPRSSFYRHDARLHGTSPGYSRFHRVVQ